MEALVTIALFIPLLSFIGLMFGSKMLNRQWTGRIACLAIFLPFVLFVSVLTSGAESIDVFLFRWIPIENINADFALRADHLALLMTLVITGVGFLIHVYAVGYMEHDEDYVRFFACLNFFVFAMLLLVLAKNLLLLFVGWEGVGLASYLLIGFWYQRPSAAEAAVKAFVVNRIGDLGLLLGILLTFYTFGTSDIETVISQAGHKVTAGGALITVLTLLYFLGAVGKSAQLPLQTWLPDAMEGPTPVSALIHAATMVTAGVYLVVRLHPLYLLAPDSLHTVGLVGAATALFAALCACSQKDLKRVLAYSTVSQLGFMFASCGAGAFYFAMFHLAAHAFMKALLFMSAGNVVHMLHDTTLLEQMGGLRKQMPKTHWLFLIGILAMAGIPPFTAFFSKDFILEEEHIVGMNWSFYLTLAASALTAFYLMRAYCLTFLGHNRSQQSSSAKEAPSVMLWPTTILAICSIIGGLLGFGLEHTPPLATLLSSLITPSELDISTHFAISQEMLLATGGAIIALSLAFLLFTRMADKLLKPIPLLQNGFYFDEIYDRCIVNPLKGLSNLIAQIFEPKIFTGTVNGLALLAQESAARLQLLQSGQIRSYVAWMAVGALFLIAYLAL